ncbi:MAG: hypothetical protein CM15mV84_260 [uncultured marine virus]|nr:MAG: hypothetical protein CM15mV84_260 [uncultured marine virus]
MDESVLQRCTERRLCKYTKNTVDADARTKKAVMQWGADKWCDQILGQQQRNV